MSKIIIYHNHCSDGNGAAWAFHKKYPDATFYAATHGNVPPDIVGKEVYIVDFSYPREVMLEIYNAATSVVLLDHHKSAAEDLAGLDFCHFDMKRSGAGMAWDYCFSDQPRPWFIDYTEDKDLWNWKLDYSREINCNLQSRPLTFETLYELEKIIPETQDFDNFIFEGEAILRFQRNMVSTVAKNAREVEILGHKVLMSNSPVLASEIASFLSIDRPFGVVWFENENGEKIYSFRSKEGGEDVSKIAARFGGGGHKYSAGVKMKLGTDIMKFKFSQVSYDDDYKQKFAAGLPSPTKEDGDNEDSFLSPEFLKAMEEDDDYDEFPSKYDIEPDELTKQKNCIRGLTNNIIYFDDRQDILLNEIDVVFENGYVNSPYGRTTYRKDEYGIVWLTINCQNFDLASQYKSMFRLPAGYRPLSMTRFGDCFQIENDGCVYPVLGAIDRQLEHMIINFKASQ